MPPTHIFLSACVFAIIAGVATGLLALRGRKGEVATAHPATVRTG
jgi:hypothetical protein